MRKEEERARASLLRLAKEHNRNVEDLEKLREDNKAAAGAAETAACSGGHLGRVLTDLPFYQIWAESAALLIDQGQFQPAREFLHEAHGAARDLGDKNTAAECLLQLARLAFREKQFGQAVQCARHAQAELKGSGTEQFWYDTTIIIVDSLAAELDIKDGAALARSELVHATTVFWQLWKTRSNKQSLLGVLLARLERRLGNLQADMARQRLADKLCHAQRAEAALLSASVKLENAATRLLAEGRTREAIQCFQDNLRCLEHVALGQPNAAQRRHHLLAAITAGRSGVQVAQRSLSDALLCAPLSDSHVMSLPLQRLSAQLKLDLVRVLLLAYDMHVEQSRADRLRQEAKDELVRAVEDYIRSTPKPNEYESIWIEVTRSAVDMALNQLADAHNLLQGMPEMRASVMLLTGRALRLHGSLLNPDPPMQWDFHDFVILLLSVSSVV